MATERTIGAVARDRVGVLAAGRAVAFMVQWAILRDELGGRTPTIDEYRDFWGDSERTAYRHQALFRTAFPGEETPDRLLDALRADWDRRRGVEGLAATPIAA